MRARSKFLYLFLITVLSSLGLTACSSYATKSYGGVVIAQAYEVRGCAFIGNIDTPPRYTIDNARYDLLVRAASIGATHVVENYAYATALSRFNMEQGIALSGRAYMCPNNTGPIINNPRGMVHLQYDLPHPEVNNDDPWMTW